LARHPKEKHAAPGGIAEAAKLVDVRPPADELRAHVAARVETLAKLGAAAKKGGSSAARLELYKEALDLALARLEGGAVRRDASAPPAEEEARP
jgi:hypothetical protein